jgi:hypothetical protein
MTTESHNPHNPDQDGDARKAICNWLRANRVDPNITPADPRASIANGQLTILQKVRRNGRDLIDPTRPNEILTETITVPVIVPPPAIVQIWLAPRCPSCGR